jgi:hypothetical protein
LLALDGYVAKALAASPDVAAAQAARRAGIARRRWRARITSRTSASGYRTMIDGLSFLPRRASGRAFKDRGRFGLGKRVAVSRERAAQENAATIGLALARDRVSVEVERAYRFVARAERGTEVARAAVAAVERR